MKIKRLVEEIENLEKEDYENLKARICTDKECKIIRKEKNLEQIRPKKEVKSELNLEVEKMVEQTLEQNVTDLTKKYKNRVSQEISRYNSSQLVSSLNSVEKVDKKLNKLYSNIIEKEIPWKERYANSIKTFLAKLKIGQMPDKIDIMTVFDRRFEEIEEIADILNEQTTEAYSKVDNLKSHIKLLRNERIELQEEYAQALTDAQKLDQEIRNLEDKGVSLYPWKNNGTDQEALMLMDLSDAYKNAFAIYQNGFKNFNIRNEALTISQFYYDVVSEIASTGKQAYDDITLMVREMSTMIENAVTCKDMLESIITADKMIKNLSKYVGKMTQISMGYMGIVKDVRINRGEILPGKVTQGIQNKYEQLGNEREQRSRELKEALKTLPSYQKK